MTMPLLDTITFRVLPPVLRRVSRWSIGLSILAVAAAIGFCALRKPMGWKGQTWARYAPIVLGALPGVVFLPGAWWQRREIRREWKASGGRLCTHCGYNVSAHPPVGICPECGGRYDIAVDAESWRQAGLLSKRHDEVSSSSGD